MAAGQRNQSRSPPKGSQAADNYGQTGRRTLDMQRGNLEMELLIIVLILLVLFGGGAFAGRGRWGRRN